MTTILAITDKKDHLISLKTILKEAFADSHMDTALKGSTGIELAIAHDPDVIFLDIVMSDMDGFEVCRQLKQNERVQDIPVVFLTAPNGEKVNRVKALEAGAEGFLTNPIDTSELTAQINAMVKIKSARRQKLVEKEQLSRVMAVRTTELAKTQFVTLQLLEDLTAQNKTRIETEELLSKSEESYRHLFDANPQPLWVYDIRTLRFLAVNDKAIKHYGFSREEFLQKTIVDIRPEEDSPLLLDYLKKDELGRKNDGIWRHCKKNGQIIWVEITSHPINWQGHKAKVILAHDITKRKLAEEVLQTTLQQLQFHENNSPLAVIEFNNQFHITKWSGKAEQLFGWKAEEVLGKRIDQFRWVHEEDMERVAILTEAMLSSNKTSNCHTNRNYHKDGSVIFCEWYNSALINSIGDLISVHSFILDVTHRSQSEAALIAAKEKAEESDRLKTSFLANMSHEIRTPLNSIIGFSELLTDPDYDSSQQFQIARMINISGNNLLSIISNILEISKIEAGQLQVNKDLFVVNQLIVNVQKEYLFKSIEKGIELILDPQNPKKEIYMEGDESKIRQVLSNFVNNAVKFTKEGSIKLRFQTMGNLVQFFVIDTGIGIHEDHHEKVFERFRQVEPSNTRKYGGNGLGLAISRGLVELLGGTIGMESEKGKGSTFYFSIPIR